MGSDDPARCTLATPLQPGILGSFKELIPVTFSRTRDKILLSLDGDKVMWYDHGKKKAKNVTLNGFPQPADLLVYTESLIQLNSKSVMISNWTGIRTR